MADIFVASSGSNTSPYDTWAKAATTAAAALAIATNADTVYVDTAHSESQITALTLTYPTSAGLKMLCVTPSGASGNSGLATGAQIAIGAGSVAMFLNGFAYVYGINFLASTNNSSAANLSICNAVTGHGLNFENCTFQLRTVNSATGFFIGNSLGGTMPGASVSLDNCTFKFSHISQTISLRTARIRLNKFSLDASGSVPTTLFKSSLGHGTHFLCENSDLTGRSFTNLMDVAAVANPVLKFRNCKIPSGVTISTGTFPSELGTEVELYNCDSGDTNYRISHSKFAGTILSETTIVRSGGSSDGTTPISYKMSSSANTKFPMPGLVSPEIFSKWNETVGSSVTATVEIVHDTNVAAGQGAGTASAFQDDEIWLEVSYLGTSGVPLGIKITDCKSDVLATAADQASSSETWTTTGLTTPLKQKLSVTFTPQEKGVVIGKVILAKASKVCYVDQKLTLS